MIETMLVGTMLIIAGLVLLTGLLGAIPALGKHLEKLAKLLGSFQTIIGVIAIVLGIWRWSIPDGLMLILAGLVLAMGILPAIPATGKHLEKLAKVLAGIQVPIGIIALILGILAIL